MDLLYDPAILQLVEMVKAQRLLIDAMTVAAHEQAARVEWLEGVIEFISPRRGEPE